MPNTTGDSPIKFIDLFAGIGGFHMAMHSASSESKIGVECVFASEWDSFARKTYEANFMSISPKIFVPDEKTSNLPLFAGDITKVPASEIPDFDLLCGGFPCQPFSQAGLKKGLDEARGTLFFDIVRILKEKRPSAYFLENVRGLLNHRSGDKQTIQIIEDHLTRLGYSFNLFKVKASDYGVPQHRPRLFMIGFKSVDAQKRFESNLPSPQPLALTMSQILGGVTNKEIGYTLRVGGRRSGLKDRRNWDTYLVDGTEIVLNSSHGLAMQGFPPGFRFPAEVPETQAMKQLGNSVAVPAIAAFARSIVLALKGEVLEQG